MKRDIQQITNALRAVMMPFRQQGDYPATNANVAYLLYDICTERNLPERSIYDILGYRGYLYVAKTRYYATPEGKQVLEEALAMLDESEVAFCQILIPPPLGSPCKQGEPFFLVWPMRTPSSPSRAKHLQAGGTVVSGVVPSR